MTDGLFPSDSPLLPWLPDETLFSLCSRHHRLWGYASDWQTAHLLFGGRRIGIHHDLPSGLDEFCERTGGRLGLPAEIAAERTLLRFYRPFLEAHEAEAAVQTMRGRSVAHLKFRLGLLTSRFRANHPLKACPECMKADFEATGWVYWHIAHQYPGVWVCPKHACWLRVSTVKSTGVERFLWHLPMGDRLTAAAPEPSQAATEACTRLARNVVALIEQATGAGVLQLQRVQPALMQQAARQGWVTRGGSVRMNLAAPAYLNYCAALRVVPEFARLPGNLAEAGAQLGRLLHRPPRDIHPLRILLAIDWLFDDASAYLAAALLAAEGHRSEELAPGSDGGGAAHDSDDRRKQQVLDLVSAGVSVSAAAGEVGVAVATAMAWLAAAGIAVPRRPKILRAEVLAALVKDLRTGKDKSEVAQTYGVSVVTVTRVLRTVVGLQSVWHAARFARAQTAARAQWLKALEQYPALGIKLLRAIVPSAFAWLYRNDRAWLVDNAPPPADRNPALRSGSVRWDERDAHLSQAVLDAALTLSHSSSGKPLRLWQLYQAVPELKAKLASLHRLPLTSRVIETALGRRSRRTMPRDLFD